MKHLSRSKTRLHIQYGFALIELMIVAAIIALILAIAIPFYSAYKRSACDRAAAADISNLAAAMERLKTELDDNTCSYSEIVPNVSIEWLMGPYYGWGGTNRKCKVMARRGPAEFSNEVWACAKNGSRPTTDTKMRYVYRISLSGGTDLELFTMECGGEPWSEYGGRGSICYTSSMIQGKDCEPTEPIGKIDCSDYKGSM